jgi:hypothetical protein
MPIQFNLPSARAGAPNTVGLNESRVEKILNAKTLGAAQRMGFFDKIRDFFKGGTKAEAIRELYEQVTQPQPHEAGPVDMLHRFQKLRSLAQDEHKARFTVAHQKGEGESQHQWSFELAVDGTALYASPPIDETPGRMHADFAVQAAVYEGMDKSVAEFRRVKLMAGADIANLQGYIERRVEAMTDDPSERSKILERLDDSLFCRAHFQGIEELEPGKTFKAKFQRDGEEPVTLLLSGRPASNGQFREATLREALAGSRYANLRELLSRDHLTRADNHLRYAFDPATGGLHNALLAVMNKTEATSASMFAFVRDLHPANNPYFEVLRKEIVDIAPQVQVDPEAPNVGKEQEAQLTLMDICFPDNHKEDAQLARIDRARLLLPNALQFLPQAAEDLQAYLANSQRLRPRTKDTFALETIHEATDDEVTARFLKDNLHNDLYSRSHFKGIQPGETSATFKAVFQREGEAEQILVFSNRDATNRELRSGTLQKLLSEVDYGNLRDLFSTGMNTAVDAYIGAIARNYLEQPLLTKLNLDRFEDLPLLLMHLKVHGPAELAAQTFEALRGARFAQTHLLELLMGDDAPLAPAAEPLIANGLRA